MSLPNIDGYTSREPSLLDEWPAPSAYPVKELIPADAMAQITRYPIGWLTVEETWNVDHDSDGVSTLVITPGAKEAAFKRHEWSARHIGQFSIVGDNDFELGLLERLGKGAAEFFCQVQPNHGLRPPTVEISLPFVEHPLVRTELAGTKYRVQVRALEFRRYLGQRGVLGLIQHDHARWASPEEKQTLHTEKYDSEWCTFTWSANGDVFLPGKTALSRLLGKTLVTGLAGRPNPAWLDYGAETYPDFLIGVDPESGQPTSFTCDPDELANYFGKNPGAPHYLTPVQFDSKVLNRYLDEPERYAVSPTRISCADMWSISIGRTSTGDVDVYLGDLGRDLPWQELDHWRSHNVLPRGRMDEDRFRRDFLGQWAGDLEPLDALRAAYRRVHSASQTAFGWDVFRPLDGPDLIDFERLQPPTLTGQRALLRPVLVLTKALVDSIDVKAIKRTIGPSDLQSLGLLELLLEHLGGDTAAVGPFRDLYRLRSSGGLAHLAGESRHKIYADLGIADLTPAKATDALAVRLANSLDAIADQLETRPEE
jgi:hypothetical protein